MEDFIGIIIFALFMILRTKKDRNRGMRKGKKKTPQEVLIQKKHAQTQTQKKPVYDSPVIKAKQVAEQPVMPRKKQKPANVKPKKVVDKYIGEKNSTDAAITNDAPVINVPQQENNSFAFNLRQAVIWSEVLDKPRFKGPYKR